MLEGRLTYRILEPVLEECELGTERPGIIEPGIRHEVEPNVDEPEVQDEPPAEEEPAPGVAAGSFCEVDGRFVMEAEALALQAAGFGKGANTTNTLVVGNTVRPLTDRLKISREKLAYLVDSTAAPVACIAVLTTWIGYELGLISKAIEGLEGFEMGATAVFLNSIPYSFYPILAIFFVFVVGWTGKDFGPMRKAELRARIEGLVAPVSSGDNPEGPLNVEVGPEIPPFPVSDILRQSWKSSSGPNLIISP